MPKVLQCLLLAVRIKLNLLSLVCKPHSHPTALTPPLSPSCCHNGLLAVPHTVSFGWNAVLRASFSLLRSNFCTLLQKSLPWPAYLESDPSPSYSLSLPHLFPAEYSLQPVNILSIYLLIYFFSNRVFGEEKTAVF